MKICPINELVQKDFNVKFLNALQQFWRNTKSFQCIDEPKKQNLFLFVNGFTITYTDKEGKVYVAHSGDVIYTPLGNEYRVCISDAESENAHTVGINFLLFDDDGQEIVLSDKIEIFRFSGDKLFSVLFAKALTQDVVHRTVRGKILLLEILCSLASLSAPKGIPERIANCLEYLAEHIEENPTISHLARMCKVSEVYFRKQFKESIGMTPVEYRNLLRMKRAQTYLEYGDISIQEISDTLGYATVSHFIKEFKAHNGSSPLRYRKGR